MSDHANMADAASSVASDLLGNVIRLTADNKALEAKCTEYIKALESVKGEAQTLLTTLDTNVGKIIELKDAEIKAANEALRQITEEYRSTMLTVIGGLIDEHCHDHDSLTIALKAIDAVVVRIEDSDSSVHYDVSFRNFTFEFDRAIEDIWGARFKKIDDKIGSEWLNSEVGKEGSPPPIATDTVIWRR